MKYEQKKVKTEDGATLNVWDFPAKVQTAKLVLIAYNGEGNMAGYLKRVDQLTAAGFNVVTFDYRGYGESSEFEIDNSMYVYPHFQDDVKAMIDYCRQQNVSNFDIYGRGIGAGLSLGIGYNRVEIRRIIADTPFLSMEDSEERFSSWDQPMEVPFTGYEKRFEPIYALDNAPAKNVAGILIIVGSNDILFPVAELEKLNAKQKKLVGNIYVVENPDRKDNFKINKATCMEKVISFLN
jgi:alpha/beta superfamily hydrolase